MSSSVFKEYPSQHTEVDSTTPKSDSNLVVFINKNGSVSVDHSALQNLLVNDATATNTSVSVIRVGSPTPSLEMELNEQEELENEIRNAELGSDDDDEADNDDEHDDNEDEDDDDDEDEEQIDEEIDSNKPTSARKRKKTPQQKIPNVSLTVENYFNPEEAKQLASDILSIAGISNPLQISVDFDFKRFVVANDHCYTPYTSPSQRNPPEEIVGVRTPATITRVKQPIIDKSSTTALPPTTTSTTKNNRKATVSSTADKAADLSDGNEEQSDASEDEQYTDDSDQTYVSPSESDRDSDLDFSVKERSVKAKKLIKNRLPAKVRPPKLVKGLKKRQSVGADNSNPQTTDEVTKKKPPKALIRTVKAVNIAATSTPITKTLADNIQIPNTTSITLIDSVASNPISTIPKIVSVSLKPKLPGTFKGNPSTIKLIQRPPSLVSPNIGPVGVSKNVKKPIANSESALFSDMTSLFSTPDLIRKVNDTPNTSNRVTNISVINLPPVTLTPIPLNNSNTTNSNLSKTLFMSLTPTSSRPKPIVTTSIRNTVKMPNNALPNMIFSNVIQRPANPPFPPVSFQSNMSNTVEHCQVPMNNVHIHSVSIPSSTNHNIIPFTPLLNDVDLLDGLGNVEDALSEDLMQHVAKLVEDKNLQQVIDQQVLGVRPANHLPKTCISQQPALTPTAVIQKLTDNLPTTPTVPVATKPKAEPIQIVRSDGRVITLPPIEAPTTRGAKRRAQNQEPSSAASSPSSIETTPKSLSRRPSLVPERRISVAASRKSMTPKNKSVIATPSPAAKNSIGINSAGVVTGFNPNEVIELDDDDEEDGSDGSYNSEDDPYRLWCICRTPHNNRFMICCDKCEDWFHGKCVNVTKALGVEMEERGVEWVCPNCIKKHPHLHQRQMAVLGKKISSRKSSNSSLVQELSATVTAIDNSLQSCIVCKKSARYNSIYCSDDCIRVHAQTTKEQTTIPNPSNTILATLTPPIPYSPTVVAETHSKGIVNATASKNTRVEVFERSTGRFLTGNYAPTVENLKRWLLEHPTFEVVNSGSAQANAIKAKKQQLQQLSRSMAQEEQKQQLNASQQPKPIQTTLKIGPAKNIQIINPQTQSVVIQTSIAQSSTAKQSPQRVHKNLPNFLSPTPNAATQKNVQQPVVSKPSSTPMKSSPVSNTLMSPTPKPSTVSQSNKSASTTLPATASKPSPVGSQNIKSASSPLVVASAKQSPASQIGKTLSTPVASTSNKQNPSVQNSKSSNTTPLTTSSSKPSPGVPSKAKPVTKVSTPSSGKTTSAQPEPVRVNVQRTLREQLKLRMSEQTDADFPKLTDSEIETFARNTEREMYLLFSKDTGVKYRAKYRSLMFNIKDRKNTSLFLKICDHSITAQQLVKMSADELASQELAKWRENENKHQLEMIKKSELDLLSCSKTYVLKTHKGEEVIEGSTSDRVSLDPSVSVEDVVSILNNSTVSSTSENPDQHSSPVKDTRIDSRFERYHSGEHLSVAGSSKTMSGSTKLLNSKIDRSDSKEHCSSQSDAKKTGSSQSDSKKIGSSSSGTKHRKRSRERSRDRSRSDHHGSSDKREDRNRDRSQKSSAKHSSSDKDKDKKKDEIKKHSTDKKTEKESSAQNTVVENFSMIDKILEAQSTIDRILRPEEFAKKENATNVPPKEPAVDDIKPTATNTDLEPSSTVTIPTPPESLSQQNDSPMDLDDDSSNAPTPIWTGSIFMVDVATFQIAMSSVVGDCSSVSKEMPDELDVVGRISPDTVWEYIGKIKRSINKEILVIRFDSATPDDKEAYFTLYKYLYSRKRFGVIKTKSSLIKDFYIFPLAAHKSMPSIVSNVGKEFDQNRTDLLLGIIVVNKNISVQPVAKKRSSAAPAESLVAKLPRISEKKKTNVSSVVSEEARYTPPCSPKVVPAPVVRTTPAPFSKLLTSNVMDDGDEPYSPGGSDDDDDGGVLPYASLMAQVPSAVSTNPQLIALMSSVGNSRDQQSPTTSLDQADLQRKMEELVRQIEVQKQEIALLGGEKPTSTGLSDIAIPSNLKEILNSINGKASGSTAYGTEEYDPMVVQPSPSAIAYHQLAVGYTPASKVSAPSKLAQLTDEELLNMVPDEIRNEIMPAKRPPAHLDQSGVISKYTVLQEPLPPGMDEEYVP